MCRRMPGCCAVGSAPALGAGGREFESRHSDHKKSHDEPFINAVLSWLYLLLLRVHFARMSLIFALFWAKIAVKGAWGVPQQVTGTALLYIRKHCLHALGPLQGHTTFNESLVCYTPPGMDAAASGTSSASRAVDSSFATVDFDRSSLTQIKSIFISCK